MEGLHSLPKLELHAHLNGSIRTSTLLELAIDLGEKGGVDFSDAEHAIVKKNRSLNDVFKLFDIIHLVTADHDIIKRITREVVEDFASENVVYAELRTTPKNNESIGMTKRSYVEAVVEGLRTVRGADVDFCSNETNVLPNHHSDTKKIIVRLLLSIDRNESTASATETVKLALEMKKFGVVGIDLCGNPSIGEWATFLPALKFAREQGLPITLHCGEVPNKNEIKAMIDFCPERIGHACWLDDEEWKTLKLSKIPFNTVVVGAKLSYAMEVEICLTSNIQTASVSSIERHHFADLYKVKHPLVLCTDDKGVFSTSLSNEYILAASAFGLGKHDLFQITRNAVEFIFAGDHVKNKLKLIFDSAIIT